MKIFLVVLLIGTGIFFWQTRTRTTAPAAETEHAKAAATSSVTPRPVSEHNWAKHSLDRAHAVTDQVAKTRKDNEQP
jgi:hypothetical protein